MIRVFPRRTKWTPTDELAFVGDPPLFRPPDHPVRISVCFTWDIPEAQRLKESWSQYYSDIQIGGPAFGDPGGEFIRGNFIKWGVTITSRGCPNRCPWCYVPEREGRIRELAIIPGWIIQDNNLLACSDEHVLDVFIMLQRQKRGIIFSGGLDSRLFTKWHVELLTAIKVKELWFACDTYSVIEPLKKVRSLLFYPQKKMRCYVMIGYGGESLKEAQYRLETVYKMGFLPFAQLYRDRLNYPVYGKEWKDLARKWSRPAAYRGTKNNENQNIQMRQPRL